jgi:hypothetical protein
MNIETFLSDTDITIQCRTLVFTLGYKNTFVVDQKDVLFDLFSKFSSGLDVGAGLNIMT